MKKLLFLISAVMVCAGCRHPAVSDNPPAVFRSSPATPSVNDIRHTMAANNRLTPEQRLYLERKLRALELFQQLDK